MPIYDGNKSNDISEFWVPVAQTIRIWFLQTMVPFASIALLVLPVQVAHLRKCKEKGNGQCADVNGVAETVLWSL